MCNLNELFNCLLEVTDQFVAIKNAICDCPVECERIRYDTKLSRSYFPAHQYLQLSDTSQETYRQNYVRLLFYFDQLEYTEVTEKSEYSTIRYVADIGNHVALFTGAGILTFFELFELCHHN